MDRQQGLGAEGLGYHVMTLKEELAYLQNEIALVEDALGNYPDGDYPQYLLDEMEEYNDRIVALEKQIKS